MRKAGRVIYNTGTFAAPRARTVYRALDAWAHQLSVAARSYLPFYADNSFTPVRDPSYAPVSSATFPHESWREYAWSSTSEPSHIYFHPSEAGKAIMLSFEYNDGGNPRKVVGSILTIRDDILDAASISALPAGFVGASGKVARLDLTNPQGAEVPATAILSVQGAGMTARTAWLDNERYTQQVVNGYRPLAQP